MADGTAVITGADQPLGAAVADAMSDDVDTLVIGGREEMKLADLATDLEDATTVAYLRTDPRDEYDLERLMETAARTGDSIDVLLPCARVHHAGDGTVLGGSYASVDDELRANLRGVYATIREAAPHTTDETRIVVPVAGDDEGGIYPVAEVAIAALVSAIADDRPWPMAPVNVGTIPLHPEASPAEQARLVVTAAGGARSLDGTTLTAADLAT